MSILLYNVLQNCVNSILMPVSICTQKEFLSESTLNVFFLDFSVTFGLGNFHMGGEVKGVFFSKTSR